MTNYGDLRHVDLTQHRWAIGSGSFAAFVPNKNKTTKAEYPYKARRIHTCREEFHYAFHKKMRTILFSHSRNQGKFVASFINRIENQLGLKGSKFGPTQRNNITWIVVSPFWMHQPMRRSLFTVLLRAGRTYRRPSLFENALWSNSYLSDTKEAVRRFLDGYTTYKGRSGVGWHSVFDGGFHGPSQAQLERLLVKKK